MRVCPLTLLRLQVPCPAAGIPFPQPGCSHTPARTQIPIQRRGRAEPGSSVWHPGAHLGVKCPGEPLAAPLPIPGAGSARFVLGCQMGRAGGQRWQRHTELLYSLWREKCHPARAWGISIPPHPLLLPHTAVNETVCWSQTNADGLPGARRWERARRAAWHFWWKHVACWSAKSLVGGLYLFFKELVRFIYTRQRLHVLEERGETHSLSAGCLEPCLGNGGLGELGAPPGSPHAPGARGTGKGPCKA